MIDFEKLKEPFPEEDVEWRAQSTGTDRNGNPYARILAFVTARAIQERLDIVCGQGGWQTHFRPGPSNGVICELTINCGGEWITKSDGSDLTNVEPVKGAISGALKRAGSMWGIGRYLYSLGTTWAEFTPDGKYRSKIDDKWYSWNPPALPAWALPTQKATKQIRETRTTKSPTPTPTAESLDLQISEYWRTAGFVGSDVHYAWEDLKQHAGADNLNALTPEQKQQYIESLKERFGEKEPAAT